MQIIRIAPRMKKGRKAIFGAGAPGPRGAVAGLIGLRMAPSAK
jgi:hypothetical protein